MNIDALYLRNALSQSIKNNSCESEILVFKRKYGYYIKTSCEESQDWTIVFDKPFIMHESMKSCRIIDQLIDR